MKIKKKTIFQIIISILFLVFLFFLVKPTQILKAFNQAEKSFLLFAILLLPLNIILQFFRWSYLVKRCNKEIPNMEILNSIFYSYSYSIFTPARIGDIGRAYHISHKNKKETISLAIYEKIFASISVLIIGFITLSIYKNIIYIIGAVILLCILFNSKKISNKIPFLAKHFPPLKTHSPIKLFIICILFIFIYIYQFFLLINSFHPISLLKTFFPLFLVILSNAMPFTLNGLGFREILSIYLFKPLGVTEAQAASASLLLFFINILIPTFIGFVLHLIPEKIKKA